MTGTIILGRYRILDIIGRGGMSCVYLAEHINLHNKWAIKAVHKDGRKEVALLAEPNILKKLSHFALPRIVDICEDEQNLYIIMDYIEGIGLDQFLSSKGGLDEDQVVAWGKELCDVISYLHHQNPPIIYRDLKPGNLIIDKNNRLKMIDFGIAVENTKTSEEESRIYLTKGYAAPEQYLPQGQKDLRIDIYALGATLYAMCTGRSPGTLKKPLAPVYELNQGISDGLDTIIKICMKENPDERFQSAQQVLYALNHITRYNAGYQKARRRYQAGIAASLAGVFLSVSLIFGGIAVNSRDNFNRYTDLITSGIQEAESGNYDEARAQFDTAAQLNPDLEDAYLCKANTYISQYQYDECLDYIMNTVMKQFPQAAQNGKLCSLLGRMYDRTGDLQEAVYFYERAYQQEPDEISYLHDYIYALIQTGEVEQARTMMNVWREKGGSASLDSYLSVWLAAKEGNIGETEEKAKQCLEQSQDEVLKKNVVLLLADMYGREAINTGDIKWYEKKIQILNQSDRLLAGGPYLEIVENKGQAFYQMANLTGQAKDYQQAAACFKQLLDRGYLRPYLYRNIAIIYQTQGLWEDAEEVLLQMLGKYPDEYTGWYQLALLYLETESEKPEDERDYSGLKEAYQNVRRLTEGTMYEQETEPLVHSVTELAERGWIQWEP